MSALGAKFWSAESAESSWVDNNDGKSGRRAELFSAEASIGP